MIRDRHATVVAYNYFFSACAGFLFVNRRPTLTLHLRDRSITYADRHSNPAPNNTQGGAPQCYHYPLNRLPASRLLLPRSGLERSDFVRWPEAADPAFLLHVRSLGVKMG
jgi:hypothetical protein